MSGFVKVLTYENPYTFFLQEGLGPYIDTPHICATKSLAKGVKSVAGGYIDPEKTLSMGEIIEKFYYGWNSQENKFIQYSQLSDLLRSWDGSGDLKVLQSFKRNKLELLMSMRGLEEIGLTPQDLLANRGQMKVEERLFCDVWEKMRPNFARFMKIAGERLKDLETAKHIFKKMNLPIMDNTIVLHGFYFITPLQHYVLTKWKQAGLNLVFLNLYVDKYPSIFSFLDKNFSEENGWAKKEDWVISKGALPKQCHSFASAFEGIKVAPEQLSGMEEKSYDYMFEFINDINEDHHYVTPGKKEIKERIREYKPNAFHGNRHFLSYPIGQYLLHLHSIWNEEKGNYYLNGGILLECFSSGWLQIEGENARQYTEELKSILPYFEDCRLEEEWECRFLQLINSKRSANRPLKDYNLKRDNYLEAVRVNPMLRFSYFSVPVNTLKKLHQFFMKLIKDTKWLVNIEEERVSIKTHFGRIQTLLDDSNIKSTLVEPSEKALVDQLEEMLKSAPLDEQKYHIGDLSEAIVVYLRNGMEDPEAEEEKDKNDGKVNLHGMDELDGLILKKGIQELHLCVMDEKNFPIPDSSMPWPLSSGLISSLNNRSFNMHIFRKENSLYFSKYLFFTALYFQGEMRFSWVKNWNENEQLEKSIYIQLLNVQQGRNELDGEYRYQELRNTIDEEEKSAIRQRLNNLPPEEFIEMNLCQRRFFYSTVVDEFSTYQSSFHQGFLIGNMVKVYAAVGKTKGEIINMLKNVFPFLSDIRLRTIIDQNVNENYVAGMRKYGLEKRMKYNGVGYPVSSLYFQFLTHRGAFQSELWKSSFEMINGKRNKRSELIGKIASQTTILPEASPSKFCKLCPHGEYCEDAYYAVDIAKKGFDDHETDNYGA